MAKYSFILAGKQGRQGRELNRGQGPEREKENELNPAQKGEHFSDLPILCIRKVQGGTKGIPRSSLGGASLIPIPEIITNLPFCTDTKVESCCLVASDSGNGEDARSLSLTDSRTLCLGSHD